MNMAVPDNRSGVTQEQLGTYWMPFIGTHGAGGGETGYLLHL
jgi:hypothetical protein